MARVYASADELAGWVGDYPPVNASTLLARASLDVDSALVGAVYDTDDDGMPTEEPAISALRDAVCAQVASWCTPGEGASGRLVPAVPPAERCLTEDAAAALRVAGLLPVTVRWR